jgi:hypothetical protein
MYCGIVTTIGIGKNIFFDNHKLAFFGKKTFISLIVCFFHKVTFFTLSLSYTNNIEHRKRGPHLRHGT